MIGMTHRFQWPHWALSALLALSLSLSAPVPAHATELPRGVLNYLKQKDPHVKVRFDGLILFSNGDSYVPVIPQDPSLNPDPQQVIASQPEKAAYPDLVEFDNHYFLIRLIQTTSGRLTFPKMDDYPLQLKEGMLPQDFVLPSNLFIPVELKVILGALPYNPNYKPVLVETASTPPVKSSASTSTVTTPKISHPTPLTPKGKPVATTPGSTKPKPLPNIVAQPPKGTPKESALAPSPAPSAYVFDLTEQKLLAIDLQTGRKQTDVPMDCVPSSLTMSPDGKQLFAPCLSTNELVVVDTGSNLVKTRVAVGQKPDSTLFVTEPARVLVSNRYSPYLSVVDPTSLSETEKIDMPGNGGVMAAFPAKTRKIVVADAFKAVLYVVNLDSKSVEKTIPSLNDVSALKVLGDDAGNYEIWMASRTEQKVMSVDTTTGTALASLTVGQKPVGFAAYGERLYVLSAGDSQIDVINWPKKTLLPSLALDANSFPTGFTTMPYSSKAFITTASGNQLIKLDLASAQLENQLPVDFRGSIIAVSPNSKWVSQEPAVPASSRLAIPLPTPGKVATPTKSNDSQNKAEKSHQKKSATPATAANSNLPAANNASAKKSGITPDKAAKSTAPESIKKPISNGKAGTNVAMPLDPAFHPDREEAGNPITPLKEEPSQPGASKSTNIPASTPVESEKPKQGSQKISPSKIKSIDSTNSHHAADSASSTVKPSSSGPTMTLPIATHGNTSALSTKDVSAASKTVPTKVLSTTQTVYVSPNKSSSISKAVLTSGTSAKTTAHSKKPTAGEPLPPMLGEKVAE
jgi:hypothetical protein